MAEHPNAAVIRASLEAMNRGDMEAAANLVADDVVWHYLGGAEPIRGKAAMGAMSGEGDYTITAQMHDIVANDEHAIALVEATATRGGRTFRYRTAEIFHLRDGRISERWAFSDDTAAIIDFFA
jgi:uncharacterized protein